MKYIAAYALCALSGATPSAKDVEAVLKTAGATVDNSRLELLIKEMSGKSFNELVAEGNKKLSCGVATSAAAPTAAPVAAAAAKKPEAKPAPKKVEEDDDDDMGMGGLF